nr:uncharacterized protein LOC122273207 [Parasteatoda tepidariorum]
MITVKRVHIVSARNMPLCSCLIIPCHHFTLEDHAIFLSPTPEIAAIVQKRFNFALFILHLCQFMHRNFNVHPIITHILTYRIEREGRLEYFVNINKADPDTGKTALHYACLFAKENVVNFLLSSPGIDPDRIDDLSFPPLTYYPLREFPCSNDSKLRTYVIRKSQKLYNFLFHNYKPQTWDSTIFEHVELNWFLLSNGRQIQKLLREIRDRKGNTLLHYAAKMNKQELVAIILFLDPSTQFVPNIKGKLPIHKCRTNGILNILDYTGHLYRKYYFNSTTLARGVQNPMTLLYYFFPDIFLHYGDKKPYVVGNLYHFVEYLSYLMPFQLRQISTWVRDTVQNTLWHIIANMNNLPNKCHYFDSLDPSIIDLRNIFGNTALHMARCEEDKKYLLQLGAHPDYINLAEEIPIQKKTNNSTTELLVCSLQCLAARKVQPKNAPGHLKHFVDSHHPQKNLEVYFVNIES